MSGHYFDAAPGAPAERQRISVTIRGSEWRFWTDSGVFAKSGLDKATAILLESVDPPPESTTVLDLGCGWGPIACWLAHHGATTWAIDINERARELTRQNAADLGLSVRVADPTEVPDDQRFDEIWSNPPVRIGKEALHALLLQWLPRLRADGRAVLVVGKNLGADSLQRWLTESGWPTSRLASSKGFRVLEVRAA